MSPGLFAREARFLKSWTDREVRIAIPTAFQIADITWKAERSAGAYSSVREFAEALVPVLRQEVIALRDEGVTYVQFDDTSFGRVYDPIAGRMLDDFDERQELAVDSYNRTVEGIDGLHKSLHLCGKRPLGPDGQTGFSPLLPSLVEMDVDMVMLELCDPDEADMRMLREIPERMDVGVGCVKAKQNGVDTPEEIVSRVKRVLNEVDPGGSSCTPTAASPPGRTGTFRWTRPTRSCATRPGRLRYSGTNSPSRACLFLPARAPCMIRLPGLRGSLKTASAGVVQIVDGHLR